MTVDWVTIGIAIASALVAALVHSSATQPASSSQPTTTPAQRRRRSPASPQADFFMAAY